MDPKKRNSRKKRYIAISFAVCAAAVIMGWAVIRLSPRAYLPPAAVDPDEVSPYLTHRLGPDFFNQVQFNEPFELLVEQHGLNDILSRGVWPRHFGDVAVSTPVVLFEKGTVYLMSRVGYFGFSAVLTLTARPVMDAQGRLNMNIQSVRLGLLPITSLAARVAAKAVEDSAAELGEWPELEAPVRAIIANASFEPVFYFDKQRIWVQGFTLEAGQLRLRLAPENKAVFKY
jgi:hypothetical protein